MERDTQRQELVKLKLSQGELNSELETSREDISKLTRQINSSEQELTRVSGSLCTLSMCVSFPSTLLYLVCTERVR